MLKKIAIFLCIFVLAVNVSWATRITRQEKQCPLCGTKFMASVVLSSNNFGGVDYDLCPHAVGSSPLSSSIWGCPYCNFCGSSSDFEKTYTAEEKNKLTQWLTANYPPTIKKPNQEETNKEEDEEDGFYREKKQFSYNNLPSYKRFEIAAQIAELGGKPNYQIGKLYLRAAWCARAQTTIFKDNNNEDDYEVSRIIDERNKIIEKEIEDITKRLDHAEAQMLTMADLYIKIADKIENMKIDNEQEKLACYCIMAANLRSSGENTKAEAFMKKAEKCENANKVSKLFEGLRNSINIERNYQKQVLKFLSNSLKDNLDENSLLEVNLLLGEMNRRTENYKEAQKYYAKLMENPEGLPELFMRAIKFAYSSMGIKDDKFSNQMDEIELKTINTYLMALSDGMSGNHAAMNLRFSKRRDLIYPRLVEMINQHIDKIPEKKDSDNNSRIKVHFYGSESDSEEIVRNCILAMSDQTEEAANFLYELLDKGIEERYILLNLKPLAYYLPSEKFIERFKKAKDWDDINNYIDFLKIIRDKDSYNALIEKAEELFSEEHLKNLGLGKEEENRLTRVYEALLDSLHLFHSQKTVNTLVKISENSLKIFEQLRKENPDDRRYKYELFDIYKNSGKSLEAMFFKDFGFSKAQSSKVVIDKEKDDIVNVENENCDEPLNNFKKWYEEHKNDDYKKIIESGFKENGLDVYPVSDPQKLYVLFEALHKYGPARVNCYKELVRRTGIMSHPEAGLSTEFQTREPEEQMNGFYSKWLDENISKLVYDEKAKKFVIKE